MPSFVGSLLKCVVRVLCVHCVLLLSFFVLERPQPAMRNRIKREGLTRPAVDLVMCGIGTDISISAVVVF